jgi:tetratricopeptide (TPR) repeat protein
LLAVELRFEERQRLLAEIIQRGEAQTFEVLAWCFPTLLEWNSPHAAWRVEQAWQADAANVRLGVALARYRIGQGRLPESQLILTRCLELSPHDLDVKATLLAYHYEQNAWDEMAPIVADLPALQDSEPWLLLKMRGHFHEHHQRYAEAIDCYRRVLKADPASAESQLGLARALAAAGMRDESQKALAVSHGLARIQNKLGQSVQNPDSIEALEEIAQICEQIGLFQQAWLVASVALVKAPDHKELGQLRARLIHEQEARAHRSEASHGP